MAETNNTHEAAQQTQYIQRPDDDEISLMELWDILVRRKKIIAAVFAIVIIAAVGYLMITKPIYESKTVVVLGSFMGSNLEDPDIFVQWVKQEYQVGDTSEGDKDLPYISDVSNSVKGANNVVTITATGDTPVHAKEMLDLVIKVADKHQNAILESSVKRETQLLESLQKRLLEINSQAKEFSERIKSVERKDAALAAMLVLEKSKILDRVAELEDQIVGIETKMSSLETRPMEVIRKPTLPVNPSKPKKKLVLALSFVLGVFMGVFAAFFAEFLANAKKMRRERVNQQLQQR